MRLVNKVNNGPMLLGMCFTAISFTLLGEAAIPVAIRGSLSNDNASGASASSKELVDGTPPCYFRIYASLIRDLASSLTPSGAGCIAQLSLAGKEYDSWDPLTIAADAILVGRLLINILAAAAELNVFKKYREKIELILWLTRSLLYQLPKHIAASDDTKTDVQDMAKGWNDINKLLKSDCFRKLLVEHKDALLDKLFENPLVDKEDVCLSAVINELLGVSEELYPSFEMITKEAPLLHQRLHLTVADTQGQISNIQVSDVKEVVGAFFYLYPHGLEHPGEAFTFWRIFQFLNELLTECPSSIVAVTKYNRLLGRGGPRVQLMMSLADTILDEVFDKKLNGGSLIESLKYLRRSFTEESPTRTVENLGRLRRGHFQIIFYVMIQMAAERVSYFKKKLYSSELEKSAIPDKLHHINAPTEDVLQWVLYYGGLRDPASATKAEKQAALLKGSRRWIEEDGPVPVLHRAFMERVTLHFILNSEVSNDNYDTIEFLDFCFD